MNQLKSITYVNSASIPFAKAELDGNTLMVGTNGAGKTTVLRSALYFYGVHEDSALGINIRKKKGFRDYYFSESNSFIGFRYSNAYGNVLVIAYRSGNSGVKFKFVSESRPIDDLTLFLDERIARSPDVLWKRLREMEYEVSNAVSTLTEYRDILYGHAGMSFKKYAFFDTKEDHNNFIHVLSNVFINSKLDASSIQKSISNTISGFEPIDLEQIERSINSFRGKYDDVTKFESNRGTVDDILRALMDYKSLEEQSRGRLDQLLSNKSAFQAHSVDLEQVIGNHQSSLQLLTTEYDEKKRAAESESQRVNDAIVILKDKIKEARSRLERYREQEIEKKLRLFSSKGPLESERELLQTQYDELTSTQNTIKEKFSRLREKYKSSIEQQLQQIDRDILRIRGHYQEQMENLSEEQSAKIEQIETEASAQLSKSQFALVEVMKKRDHAYEEKIQVSNRPLFQKELESALTQSSEDKRAYEECDSAIVEHKRSAESINALIGSIETERELALQNISIPFENTLSRQHEKIERLNGLLDVEKETFLGYVRELGHPDEALITSVLKDEVLLSKALEPSFTTATDSFFGFTIESDELEESDYSRHSIELKKATIDADIGTLEKQFKDDKSELENIFRNRLNEQRRLHRQRTEQLLELEIALPRLKNSWAKSDDDYHILLKRSELEKSESIHKSQMLYEEAVSEYQKAEQSIASLQERLQTKKRETREHIKAEKISARKHFDIEVESARSDKASKESDYRVSCERIDSDEHDSLANDGVNSDLLQGLQTQLKEVKNSLDEIDRITELVQAYGHDKKEYFDGLGAKETLLQKQQEDYKDRKKQVKLLKAKHTEQKNTLLAMAHTLEEEQKAIENDLGQLERYLDENTMFRTMLQTRGPIAIEATKERLQEIVNSISALDQQSTKVVDSLRSKQDVLYLDIAPSNSLDLAVRINSDKRHVLEAADELKRFMDEGKIEQFKEEVSNLFGLTINQLTKQTESLLEARLEVAKVVTKIRAILSDLEGISVIDSIDLRTQESSNKILSKLEQLQVLNDEDALSIEKNLFNFNRPQRTGYAKAVQIIKELRVELTKSNKKALVLDDTYELEIRASENGHDTGWQVSLDEVGSNGTDVMIKAIVNIAMLAIALGIKGQQKEEDQTYFHCILDEIGVLHPTYLKELMSFANKKQIRFLNGAPNRQLVSSFKRIYILTNSHQRTMLRPLLSKE